MAERRERPNHHGILETIIEPSKFVWGLFSYGIAMAMFLLWLYIETEQTALFLPQLLLAFALLFCLSFLIPLCHSIRLDAHGVTFNRFFKSTFYSWKVIHTIKTVTDEDSIFPSRVAIFFAAPQKDFFFGEPSRGDINVSGYYSLNKSELAGAMNKYKSAHWHQNLPLSAANRIIEVQRADGFSWGRDGSDKENALQTPSIWERVYQWRNQ